MMMLLFVLSVFVASVAGQDEYGYASQGQSLSERVDVLNSLLDTREDVEDLQFIRVSNPKQSVSQNLEFYNDFTNFIYDSITQEQHQQDARLNAVEERVTQIEELRVQVAELTETANDFSERVEEERVENKNFQHNVTCLLNDDIERFNRIEVAQQRADHLNALIDVHQVAKWNNFRSLEIEETIVRDLIDSVNRQRSSNAAALLQPRDDMPVVTMPFEPPFLGAPQFNGASPIGFLAVRPHSYHFNGYPAIYSAYMEELWNNQTIITGADMSDGGWDVDHVNLDVDNIYFDVTVYDKSRLAGIFSSYVDLVW